MNNRYLKLLISSGIKALTGAAALAATALILNSDDNGNKSGSQKTEKEAPKAAPEVSKKEPPKSAAFEKSPVSEEKEPDFATKENAVPKMPSENDAYYAAKAAQAKQADISKKTKPDITENSEKPKDKSYQAEWSRWEHIFRQLTDRPPAKRQRTYLPNYSGGLEQIEFPQISITEKEAVAFGYSFRKKSKRIRITNYHGTEKSVIIPAYIGGMLVNEIGPNAFKNSRAERVAIPDNVKKLAESAFAESNVRFVIFGKGLRSIPKMCFYNCKRLEAAVIPPHTEILGEKAFYGCRLLKYIELPWELSKIDEDCFCESGLEGFAASFRNEAFDGSVFANTPLHRNNGLILYESYNPSRETADMKVLLVGNNVKIDFKESRVRLGRNSVCAPCRLDFSQCRYLFTYRAFKYVPDYFGSKVHVIVSENEKENSFPDFVDVRCPSGEYTGWYEKLEEDSRRNSLKLKVNCRLCMHSLSGNNSIDYFTEDLTLIPDNSSQFWIYDRAVRSRYLRRVEFAGKIFSYWGCIFDPGCISLHEVKWQNSDKKELVQFIPSGYTVRPSVHRELLKAFRDRGVRDFFEPKIIENIFDNGIIRELSRTQTELPRREKILIAIDVLRSSPELYPDGTEKYSQFLKRHFNYAKNMCGKLDYPEYLEFLNNFAL